MVSLRTLLVAVGSFAVLAVSPAAFSQIVFTASGDITTVQPIFDNFNAALVATPDGSQRINWDGVPDGAAVPMSPTQFQGRGVIITNPNGGTTQVSLNGAGPTAQFGDVNPGYPQIFEPFSGDQLFAANGGTQVQVDFVVPGSSAAGVTRGFGVVFSDVDLFGPTTIQLYDASNTLLRTETVPAGGPPSGPENESFSFVGLLYTSPIIRRAVITNGNFEIAPGFSDGKDLVVMDDYLFATPQLVPEPSTWLLLFAGLGAVAWLRKNRSVS